MDVHSTYFLNISDVTKHVFYRMQLFPMCTHFLPDHLSLIITTSDIKQNYFFGLVYKYLSTFIDIVISILTHSQT